ncbi:MAG: DSBA oxidoreductase [uncultured bacterium (gcode 4)]|uniref:DSBA oxidoreductase n=1 Tax=uncultured bacterium (gcode 4) TaxID=1234023 RepID=K2G0P9_9BACT|nr:MAG: DSBA oxidoreductase [uncultured bacterium (gcode 4)]
METNDKSHLPIIVIMLLSSALIITTNYFMTKQIVFDVQQKIIENEYEKIWWKDNYNILKEIQKDEILNYVNKLKQENPELIYKMRQNAEIKESPEKKLLSWEAFKNIKWNAYVQWNSGAAITIMEYSDMECPFCKDFHNNKTLKQFIEKSEDTNYIFKNFPIPTHKYASQMAFYAKCGEKIGGWEKYLESIDKLFLLDILSETGSITGKIRENILKAGIDEKQFDECTNDKENEILVKKEFEEWLNLWINSTPTSIIINNMNWEYISLAWVVAEDDIKLAINSLLN